MTQLLSQRPQQDQRATLFPGGSLSALLRGDPDPSAAPEHAAAPAAEEPRAKRRSRSPRRHGSCKRRPF